MALKQDPQENNLDKTGTSVSGNHSEKKTDIMCGIIMPISDHNDYPKGHWQEVEEIIKDVINSIGLKSRIVSDDESVGLIQERIVTNIYNDEIVVCDVSSKNPNVMFELGLRLAFDKPTVIIIDDKTNYSFDIGSIEHLSYPSSLRFSDILSFKAKLAQKVKATLSKYFEDTNYSPFLKSFGRTIVPAKIPSSEIPVNEFFVDELKRMSGLLDVLVYNRDRNNNLNINKINSRSLRPKELDIFFKNIEMELSNYPHIFDKISQLKSLLETKSSIGSKSAVINDLYNSNIEIFKDFNEYDIKAYLNYIL